MYLEVKVEGVFRKNDENSCDEASATITSISENNVVCVMIFYLEVAYTVYLPVDDE